MQKLKNNEARPKFTGSYIKKSVYIEIALIFYPKLDILVFLNISF